MHGPLLWSTDDHCSCVQDHAFSTSLMTEKKKRSYWPSDVKDRFESFIYVLIYLFIYLFVFMYSFIICAVFDSRSELYYFHCLLLSVAWYRYITYYSLSLGKLWFQQLQRLISHFSVSDKLFKTMQYNTKALCIFVIINSYCSLLKKKKKLALLKDC